MKSLKRLLMDTYEKKRIDKIWNITIDAHVCFAFFLATVLWVTLLTREKTDDRIVYGLFESYEKIFLTGNIELLIQNIENIMLFIPLGFSFCWVYGKNKKIVILGGMCISFFVECLQYCLYLGCFEVDDILHNTLGMLVGYRVFCWMRWRTKKNVVIFRLIKKIIVYTIVFLLLFDFTVQAVGSINHCRMKMLSHKLDLEDGRNNMLVMKGNSGYIQNTNVYVKYCDDGGLEISGTSDIRSWKKIAEIKLSEGHYYITGLSGVAEETVSIELAYFDEETHRNYQLVPDIGPSELEKFYLEKETQLIVYVEAYPDADVKIIAYPAIYIQN